MNIIKRFDSFQFNKHCIFYKQIGNKGTDFKAVVMNFYTVLLSDLYTGFPQFVGQCVFIYFFKEAASK